MTKFSDWKIKTRIQLLVSLAVIILVSVLLVYQVLHQLSKANAEMKDFEETEITRVRENLKNSVDIAYKTIESCYTRCKKSSYIEAQYGYRLKNIIDIVDSSIAMQIKNVEAGFVSMEEAQEIILEEIGNMKYDSGVGYIWINDIQKPFPKMVMHPTVPDLNGKILDSPKYNTVGPQQQNLFQAFVEVCEENGDGFIEYMWPKPTVNGLTEDQPKLSYVRQIDELGWIIGTGIYIDDAIKNGKMESINNIKQMRYAEGVGYFWINNLEEPYPRMIMHPTVPDLDGKILDDPKYDTVGEEKKNLFQAFVEVSKESGDGFVEYLWPKPTENGLTEDQPKESYVKLFEPWNWIIGTGVYIDDIDATLAVKQAELQKEIISSISIYAAIGLSLMILTILILNPFIRAVTKPISHIADWSNFLAEGNLSRHLDYHSKNELGQLTGNLNKAVDSLDILILGIKKTSSDNMTNNQQLISGTEQTVQLLRQITVNTDEIKSQIDILNESITESASASQEISANINSLNNQIETQTSAVEQSTAAVEEILSSIRNVANITKTKKEAADVLVSKAEEGGAKLGGMSSLIDEITGSVDNIQGMITFINQISSQTNLLAMNAAIEAAHAGEAGKGFAVVADEIRKLAEATSTNAKDISVMLKSVVINIKSASSSSQETSLAFKEIDDEIQDMARAFMEISSTSEELAAGSDQILSAMTSLNEVSSRVQESSEEMNAGAREVAAAQELVKNISSEVLDGINEIVENTGRINTAMDGVILVTDKTAESTRELDAEVNKFITR